VAFLQKRFFNQTRSQATLLKETSGFFTLGLLSFLALMFVILIGFSLLSTGIKNITGSQSTCLKALILTQKELGKTLTQLLKLNQSSQRLNKARKVVDRAIVIATGSLVLASTLPALKTKQNILKALQKDLILKQKDFLFQSLIIKKRGFQKLKKSLKLFKVKSIREMNFYKKALAVEKEKIGKDSYIYHPVQDFKQRQKIEVFWKLPVFYPLEKELKWFLTHKQIKSFEYSCVVTLKKKGEKWVSLVYH